MTLCYSRSTLPITYTWRCHALCFSHLFSLLFRFGALSNSPRMSHLPSMIITLSHTLASINEIPCLVDWLTYTILKKCFRRKSYLLNNACVIGMVYLDMIDVWHALCLCNRYILPLLFYLSTNPSGVFHSWNNSLLFVWQHKGDQWSVFQREGLAAYRRRIWW